MPRDLRYWKGLVGDININRASYKRDLIRDIKKARGITEKSRERLLRTAKAIPANSWKWKKSWDKGKLWK